VSLLSCPVRHPSTNALSIKASWSQNLSSRVKLYKTTQSYSSMSIQDSDARPWPRRSLHLIRAAASRVSCGLLMSTSTDSFHEGPSPALGSILPAPSLFQRPRPMPASKVTSKSCHLCLDVFDKDLEANFPYRCVKCQNNSYCLSCLKDWFLEACEVSTRQQYEHGPDIP
jgi:hypothetical protein